jgi:hypothetical protein
MEPKPAVPMPAPEANPVRVPVARTRRATKRVVEARLGRATKAKRAMKRVVEPKQEAEESAEAVEPAVEAVTATATKQKRVTKQVAEPMVEPVADARVEPKPNPRLGAKRADAKEAEAMGDPGRLAHPRAWSGVRRASSSLPKCRTGGHTG